MKNPSVGELAQARGKLVTDLKAIIADSEELLKVAATVSDESFTGAKTKLEEKLRRAKSALADASQPVFDRARQSANATDDYVHGKPWTAIGVAVAVGVLIGFLTAKR